MPISNKISKEKSESVLYYSVIPGILEIFTIYTLLYLMRKRTL